MGVKKFVLFFANSLCFCLSTFCQTGGVKGLTISQNGEPLPFAGIYVKELKLGTSSNLDGKFEVKLTPGEYTFLFQYLGCKTDQRTIRVEDKWIDLNVILQSTTYTLGEVKVGNKNEDPAYAIMRKAISMSKFHDHQVEKYSARVYVRGTGRLKKIPWLARKMMDDDTQIDTGKVYLVENISEISFQQPNTFKEKAISIRTNLPENSPSPMNYINASFYKPQVEEAISPLSPKAFAYYKFKLEGSFYDGENQVNKIKVTPRSKGDNVFEGSIYIVENLWCIHSLNLTVLNEGITFEIKQLYNEVQNKIWMPSSQNYFVYGSFYGFAFEGKYQATTTDYKIKLNEKLIAPVEIIDEKTEKEKIPEATRVRSKKEKELEAMLQGDKKITRKDMRKLMNMYEKEEEKRSDAPDIISDYSTEVDSLAYKKDSLYWVNSRPIPLTEVEIKNYTIKKDTTNRSKKGAVSVSVNGNDVKENPTDSTKNKKSKLDIGWVISGRTFTLDSSSTLEWISPLAEFNFNTVEGYVFNTKLNYKKKFKSKDQFSISPTARYSFVRNIVVGKALIKYRYGDTDQAGSIAAEGGRYISQFNNNNPISDLLNSLVTLGLERNYMKLYEKEYGGVTLSHKVFDKLFFSFNSEFSSRFLLNNSSKAKPLINWKDRAFSSNEPINNEISPTSFLTHQAFTTQLYLKFFPWRKYGIINGVKTTVEGSSPKISLGYRKGWNGILGSDVDFDLIEAGISDHFKWGARGNLNWGLNAGWFPNNNKMYFMDLNHFMGNQTFIQQTVAGYRALNYYNYSTRKYFIETFLHFQTRKLVLTQLAKVRMLGLKENVFLNYLYTPSSGNYMEAGYGLDNIFRFIRFEVVGVFNDLQYQSLGFRIGIAANINNNPN